MIDDRFRKFFSKFRQDAEEAFNFIEWLESNSFRNNLLEWRDPSFRIVTGGFDPLSIEGSLSYGGRFNIGGAQENSFFPNFRMQGMLYAASSRRCAYKEAGELLGQHQLYALNPQNTLFLWDLAVLLDPYPDLKSKIDSTPFDAIWGYQKVPKVSQILGDFLRQKGGDGIIYPSTKDSEGKTLAYFAKDHEHMRQIFETSLLNQP